MKAILVPKFLINFNLYFNVSIKQPMENNTFIDFPPASDGLEMVTMKFLT